MTEREMESAVLARIMERGLYWHLCRDPRFCRGHRGFPDLAILGARFALAELKGSETRTRRHQLDYADSLMAAGITYHRWHPADLDSGRVDRELDALV
jgi:hypothetical protein